MKRLENKVAVITGGSNGFGEATSLRMAEHGAAIGILDMDSKGAELAHRIEAGGGRAMFVQVDVTDEAQVRDAMQAVEQRFGRLDILVNNAGIEG